MRSANNNLASSRWRAPYPEPVGTIGPLPVSADTVVIGGGIAGICTAYWLARQGISTVVCEKGVVAGEQSSRNWGWIRKMGRDPRELPLMMESERIWDTLDPRVSSEIGYQKSGIVYLCDTDAELNKREKWRQSVADFSLDTRLVERRELKNVLNGIEGDWAGALYTASDGRAEPHKAVAALAKAAISAGAAIRTNCAVRGIDTATGKISGAVTEHGTIACNAVVLAGGAWSSLFCASIGIRLPQLKVLASAMRIGAFEGGPEAAAWGPGFAFRKCADGGYTVANGSGTIADIVPDSFRYFFDFLPVLKSEWRDLRLRIGGEFFAQLAQPRGWRLDAPSPFEAVRVLDPVPRADILATALGSLRSTFPAFKGGHVSNHWAGMIDTTPDVLPVISGVPGIPGLFISTGFSGHGFGIGPGAGKLMAALVAGNRPMVDPSPFRFDRFSDGSKPRPGL
jgi:glycine/D-amino acid oxidase-like deaminating enzyme